MLSSNFVALDRSQVFDEWNDGRTEHQSAQRASEIGNHSTAMRFEFPPDSMSPLPFSSPSTLPSPNSASLVEASEVAELPKRISIMNVIRPIPKRISTQFYNEAYETGLTLQETNQAVMMAHDWHRRWTHQDETNHTMPEEDFYQSVTSNGPISYAYNKVVVENQCSVSDSSIGDYVDHHNATNDILICLEREGAKNPSLGSSPEEAKNVPSSQNINRLPKRHYSAIDSREYQCANYDSTPSQLKGMQNSNSEYSNKGNVTSSSTEASTSVTSYSHHDLSSHQVKRRFIGFNNNNDEEDDSDQSYESYESHHEDDDHEESHFNKTTPIIQRPMPVRPQLVKPLAIHAIRPDFLRQQPISGRLSPPVQDSRKGKIPRDILTNQFNGVDTVSPMSYSQLTRSSAMSSDTSIVIENDMIGNTVIHINREGLDLVEDDAKHMRTTEENVTDSIPTTADSIEKARDDLFHYLAISDGDVESDDFKTKVDPLEKNFLGKEMDTRRAPGHHDQDSFLTSISGVSVENSIEGMWLTLSKPNFFGKLGHNDNGDPMYTLGRMSFDMFSPTNLVCSLQGNFNQIEIVSGEERKAMLDAVPKKLREEVESGRTILRTYHIVTAFTIEPSMAAYPKAPNKDVMRPIRGLMTTYGYSLPDPDIPNRHSIWITGGRVEPNNDVSDVLMWKDFFTIHPPRHSFGEKAKLLAVKLLMGATIPEEVDPEDGSMNYVFTRPLGGHGMAYIDVICLDESLRIVRGHRGTTFVFSRVPDV